MTKKNWMVSRLANHRLHSFLVLAAASSILLFLIFGLSVLLDKQRLWPQENQRYDISEIMFASAEAACPESYASKRIADFEKCLAKDPVLSHRAFRTLNIPKLADVSAGIVPRFVDLLASQNHGDFVQHLTAKKPYIIGVKIPGRLFSPKTLGIEPSVLVFHKVTDAYFCVDGNCAQHSNKNRYLAQTVALQSSAPVPPEADQYVWIFGHDPLGAVGLYLGNGLFVAKDSDLGLARRFMPIAAHGLPIVFTLIFAAMVIVGLGFAAVWSDRFEFAAFVNFAGALALMTFPTDYILGDFYLKWPLGFVDTFTFWKTVYLPVSAITLAAAIGGFRERNILFFYTAANLLTVAIFSSFIPGAPYALVSKTWIQTTIFANAVTILGPTFVILVAIFREKLVTRNILHNPRGLYLCLTLGFFLVCGSQLLIAAWQLSRGQLTGSATPAPWAAIGLLALLTLIVHRSIQLIRLRLLQSQKDLVVATRQAAVAGTVQMLAHDARKPFTTLKMGLRVLKTTSSPIELQRRISLLTFETERNLAKIDGMIADVLEAGSKAELKKTSITPESLIESSIVDIVRIKNSPRIVFKYDFHHQGVVRADTLKALRVFGNILDNAISAMKGKGRIWFKTKEKSIKGATFIEFTIGNNGSALSAAAIEHVFETFYTKGKAGGTGLGLAICKKIINDHGGTIVCRSNGVDFVEFVFTLPSLSKAVELTHRYPLPLSSEEVLTRLRSLDDVTQDFGENSEAESLLLSEVRQALTNLGRPLQVMIVEDEAVYLESLIARLRELIPDNDQLQILSVSDGTHAVSAAAAEPPDLLICDIDLGASALDGYAVTRAVLSLTEGIYVCHHTNRLGENSLRASQQSGSDIVCPKPLGTRQIIDILQNVISRISKTQVTPESIDKADAIFPTFITGPMPGIEKTTEI